MDQELEFSTIAPDSAGIRALLDQFEGETGIKVRLRMMAWDSSWSTFVRSALYNDGPDVSEVGTTWVGDLLGMNALRPFNPADLVLVGKTSSFYPAAWHTTVQRSDPQVWSIPWLTGARLIFYRPSLLAQAGVDAQTAFSTIEQFEGTIEQLRAAGIPVPWTVPTGSTHTTLLNIASWVWAAGGDFLREDGKATGFMEPEGRRGMRAYFSLCKGLSEKVRNLNGLEPDRQFLNDAGTAVTMSGPWMFCSRSNPPEKRSADMAAALPPGASFVGGSNLVIWKYTRHPEAAVRLIRFLTQRSSQVAYCPGVGLLPARKEALLSEPFSNDPFWLTAVRGLASGRSFPMVRIWGLVEDRLTAGLGSVWADLLSGNCSNPDEALEKHLGPLAKRLDELLARA